MKRWQRLRQLSSSEFYGNRIIRLTEMLNEEEIQQMDKINRADPSAVNDDLARLTMVYLNPVILKHFEFDLEVADISSYLETLAKGGIIYLYSQEAAKKGKRHWIEAFCDGVVGALLLDNDQWIKTLAGWVDSSVRKEYARMPQYGNFCVVLAEFLTKGSITATSKDVQNIREKRGSHSKNMLENLEAIANNDSRRFEKLFLRFASAMISKNPYMSDPSPPPFALIDHDSTLLWNLANRHGLRMPEISDEIMDFVIRPETISL